MSKVIIDIGYKHFVVNAEDAIKVADLLSKAEVYESKYIRSDNGDSTTTYHVYEQEDARWLMQIMPDSIYRMAKLAGKPSKD